MKSFKHQKAISNYRRCHTFQWCRQQQTSILRFPYWG